jgi:putative transposase
MNDEQKILGRKSIRLRDYDYSVSGAYFITICVKNGNCAFGEINESFVDLNVLGKKAADYWEEILFHYKNVIPDEYVIMPNHVHGIISIINDPVGVQYTEPLHGNYLNRSEKLISSDDIEKKNEYQKVIPNSIGSIVRNYKGAVSRWSNANGVNDFQWQRGYYDRIIRNEKELFNVRQYIMNNPVRWMFDLENPKRNKHD